MLSLIDIYRETQQSSTYVMYIQSFSDIFIASTDLFDAVNVKK